jgi:hypothetical protein
MKETTLQPIEPCRDKQGNVLLPIEWLHNGQLLSITIKLSADAAKELANKINENNFK